MRRLTSVAIKGDQTLLPLMRQARKYIGSGYHSSVYRADIDGEALAYKLIRLGRGINYSEAAILAGHLLDYGDLLQDVGVRPAIPDIVAIRPCTGGLGIETGGPYRGRNYEEKLKTWSGLNSVTIFGQILDSLFRIYAYDYPDRKSIFEVKVGFDPKAANFTEGGWYVDLWPFRMRFESYVQVEWRQPRYGSTNYRNAYDRAFDIRGLAKWALCSATEARPSRAWESTNTLMHFAKDFIPPLWEYLQQYPPIFFSQVTNREKRAIVRSISMDDPYGFRICALALASQSHIHSEAPITAEEITKIFELTSYGSTQPKAARTEAVRDILNVMISRATPFWEPS